MSITLRRTEAEAEAPILWPPNGNSQLFGKDLEAGKDWGHEEKRMTEDEMAGWRHLMDMSVSKLQGIVRDKKTWYAAVLGVRKSWHDLATE